MIKMIKKPLTWTDSLVESKRWKRDIELSTWNVGSLYSSRSLTTAVKEIARYKFDLVCVQDIR
jgi:hypothetical protein